jgi:hypothetical protein
MVANTLGVLLGAATGYFGGWWDDFVNGVTNLMLAIPSLIFALAIMAVLGPGLTSLLIALGLTNWSFTCRISRASALSLKNQGYVQAAKVLGYGHARIMFTQLLPNMLGPIIVIGTLGMGGAVLAEALGLGLGLGAVVEHCGLCSYHVLPAWDGQPHDAARAAAGRGGGLGLWRPEHEGGDTWAALVLRAAEAFHEIAELAPLAIAHNKLVLNGGDDEAVSASFDAVWASADVREAAAARAEKRPPVFEGR